MGWYCYHNRKCSDCGNEFQSEYDTLLMVGDRHLLCNKCGSYSSVEVLGNIKEDEPNETYKDDSNLDLDLDSQILTTGHKGVLTTFHADDPVSSINKLKDSLHNERLMEKDNFSIHDLLFGDPNID